MKPRQNRCLYTGDCNYLFANDYRSNPSGPYDASVFHDHIDLIADGGADTYVVNPNGQVPWYPSRALASCITGYTRGNRDFVRSTYPPLGPDFSQAQLDRLLDQSTAMLDRFLDLAEAGIDWIAEIAKACRRRKIAPWVSVRMNDAHGANSWDASYFNAPPQRDPRMRLTGRALDPQNGTRRGWQTMNYERAEVRDYMWALVRELVEDYDFEGLELDWWRMPLCCELPASAAAIDQITEWHRRVRNLTHRRARKTGKPYPLGLRMPCDLDVLRTTGIDVDRLVREDLIDFISVSNQWQTTWDVPYDRLRDRLGGDIALYGCIEDAPNWMFAQTADGGQRGYRLLSTSRELLRANAAGKLAMGVDGIELFNFFCSDAKGTHGSADERSAKYDEIGNLKDLATLRGRPKHYALATTYNYWTHRFFEWAPQLPAAIEPGGWKPFEISMCSEPAGAGLELFCQVIIDRKDPPPRLGVSFNGSWPTFAAEPTDRLLFRTGAYTHHIPQHQAWNYRLDARTIRDGWNRLVVFESHDDYYAHRQPAELIHIIGLELGLLPRP